MLAAASRTAARSLCNVSLRTASGPEGSSAKQILTCAAGSPGRGGTCGSVGRSIINQQSTISNSSVSNYQVLARKWRPQRFEDVIGQASVTPTLQHAIAAPLI